jgi:hypothetical protein
MKAICCSVNFDFLIGELPRQPTESDADLLTLDGPVCRAQHKLSVRPVSRVGVALWESWCRLGAAPRGPGEAAQSHIW